MPRQSYRRPIAAFHISFPWVMVLLGAVLLMVSGVQVNTFGVFFKPIAEEFGWSRASVSGAYALRSFITVILAIPTGYWSDRYGSRRVALPSFVLLGLGLLISSKVTMLWQFFLVQGLLLGIASSAPFVCVMSMVGRWHDKRPGLALGLASAGFGLSSIVFPPIAAKLILAVGWQGAMVVLGLVTLALAVPASLLIKDRPSDSKVLPDSGRPRPADPFEVWRLLPRCFKSRVFLAIMLMLLFFYTACILVTNHLVNYVTDAGISTMVAATMMSVMGIASTTGRLAMGTFSDRIGTRVDSVVCCVCMALSLILLIFKVPVLMWVAVVLFGVGYGGGSPLIPAIVADHFGTKRLATLTGVALVGANLGTAVGPWMGGFIFDITDSYLWALALATAFTIVAMIIALSLPSPTPETRSKGETLLEPDKAGRLF